MPNTTLKSIDQYSLFELMGLNKMTAEQQEAMLLNINALIWNDFLGQRLNLLLTEEQLLNVRNKLINQKNIEQILDYLVKVVPNIMELLTEFTRQYKFEYIKQHFRLMIEDQAQMASQTKDEASLKKASATKNKFIKALDLLNDYQWEDLIKLLA